MKDFKFIKRQYLSLRGSLLKFIEKFNDHAYAYQPTMKSNTTAWIVPHIAAFEKIMVTDKIDGYQFDEFISQKEVDVYKPGVNAYAFKPREMLDKESAMELLKKTQEASVKFFDDMISGADSVKDVDAENAFGKFILNYSHETEHFGQLKYLLGTWKRIHEW